MRQGKSLNIKTALLCAVAILIARHLSSQSGPPTDSTLTRARLEQLYYQSQTKVNLDIIKHRMIADSLENDEHNQDDNQQLIDTLKDKDLPIR